ncbi:MULTISPECIES: Bbp19 family protein [Cronobacter]|uniref:Bbp19 family protein n=1 Tax=Cronobacter TaxID=413496 RepID=UPI000CFDCA47|nr:MULTISPECIES: hypothetical protein [Cronobacter]MDT3597021.1 hypothetical protein [Cronobacter malonaticus]
MTDAYDIYAEDQPTAEQIAQQKIREERDVADIRAVMGTESGRRVIWRVLSQGKPFSTTFAGDPYVTAFNEGQRNMAVVLMTHVMTCCPELYLKMADEAAKQE